MMREKKKTPPLPPPPPPRFGFTHHRYFLVVVRGPLQKVLAFVRRGLLTTTGFFGSLSFLSL